MTALLLASLLVMAALFGVARASLLITRASLTAERDRARATAVALEQDYAALASEVERVQRRNIRLGIAASHYYADIKRELQRAPQTPEPTVGRSVDGPPGS